MKELRRLSCAFGVIAFLFAKNGKVHAQEQIHWENINSNEIILLPKDNETGPIIVKPNASVVGGVELAQREILMGHKKKLTTKGNAKSLGLELELSYPASWENLEGNRPHVAVKLNDKKNNIVTVITIKNFKEGALRYVAKSAPELSDAQLKEGLNEMLKDQELVKTILSQSREAAFKELFGDSLKLSKNIETKIDSIPAYIVLFSGTSSIAGYKMGCLGVDYMFFYDDKIIDIQISQGLSETECNLDRDNQQLIELQKLASLIVSSAIIQNKWNGSNTGINKTEDIKTIKTKDPQDERTIVSDQKLKKSSENPGDLILFGLLPWVLGILSPYIARTFIFKKPLQKNKVKGWLILYLFISVICLQALQISVGMRPSRNYLPWLLFYWIGIWILTREAKTGRQADVEISHNGIQEERSPTLDELYQKAVNGDAEAQYLIAIACETGDGAAIDHEASIQWLSCAAAQNYIPAIEKLAEQGLAQDPSKSGQDS